MAQVTRTEIEERRGGSSFSKEHRFLDSCFHAELLSHKAEEKMNEDEGGEKTLSLCLPPLFTPRKQRRSRRRRHQPPRRPSPSALSPAAAAKKKKEEGG